MEIWAMVGMTAFVALVGAFIAAALLSLDRLFRITFWLLITVAVLGIIGVLIFGWYTAVTGFAS